MAEKNKAGLQASNAKLEARIDKFQQQLREYQKIQVILLRRLTNVETTLAQNSQFLLGDGEMHLKPLESTSMHENYEEEDEEVEHEELEMSGVEDYMSVTSESQYTPMMNFIAEANPIQANSGTRKRKKPLKVKSKSITNQKEPVAADNNEEEVIISPLNSSNSHGQVGGNAGKRVKCDLCPKTFANKYLLQRHSSLHGEGEKYQCVYCKEYYTREDSVRRHILKFCEKAKQESQV